MKLSEFLEYVKNLSPDTELILVDPDTSWLLIPSIFIDDNGINIIAQYGDDWNKTP